MESFVNKLLQVNCPHCDKIFFYYQSDFRPFCCEKCKMIDLGHWFHESYRVPTKEQIQGEKKKEETANENSYQDNEEDSSERLKEEYDDDYEDDENNY